MKSNDKIGLGSVVTAEADESKEKLDGSVLGKTEPNSSPQRYGKTSIITRIMQDMNGETDSSCISNALAGIFPRKLERIVEENYKQNCMPVPFQYAAILACSGTALGSSRVLQVKKGYITPPIIWTAEVGSPGTNKSAPLSFYSDPLKKRTLENKAQYDKEKKLYETDQKDGGRLGYTNPKFFTQLYAEAATMEKLQEIVNNNQRGLLICRDEILSWTGEMDKYHKGGDRKSWLTAWNGNGLWNQTKQGDVMGNRSHLCICGGIQPDALKDLAKGPDDGFLERILFFGGIDINIPVLTNYESGINLEAEWKQIVDTLLSLKEEDTCHIVTVTTEAFKYAQTCEKEFSKKAVKDSNGAVYAKLNTYRFRTSLLLSYLDWACGECEQPSIVQLAHIERAQKLMLYCLNCAVDVRRIVKERYGKFSLPEFVKAIHMSHPDYSQDDIAKIANTSQQNVSKILSK